ncbi:hypothetical protein K449DRAFT_453147 [Hypoxylon sp. EC38]|nr:hypothetical protein K449DRAFT_453147 [Hypoxylon sp. EC38]
MADTEFQAEENRLNANYFVDVFIQNEELDALLAEVVHPKPNVLDRCTLNSAIKRSAEQTSNLYQLVFYKYSTGAKLIDIRELDNGPDTKSFIKEFKFGIPTSMQSCFNNGSFLREPKDQLNQCITPPTISLKWGVDTFTSLILDATGLPMEQFESEDSLLCSLIEEYHHEVLANLKQFAESLHLRSRSLMERTIADFISENSMIVSAELVGRLSGCPDLGKPPKVSPDPLELYVIETFVRSMRFAPINFATHKDFLLLGANFQNLFLNLKLIRVKAEIAARSRGPAEKERLLSTLLELQFLKFPKLQILKDSKPLLIDFFKERVEKSTGSGWNWWPFAEPRKATTEGEVMLTWKCGCGMTRQEHMPLTLAKLLAHVIPRKSTNASNEDNSSDLESSSMSTGRSQGSTTDSDDQSSTSYGSHSSMNIIDSDATSLSDTTNDAHVTIDNINMKYVFIIIKASGSKLVQLEVANMKAVEFFRNLTAQYKQTRGFFRTWFSIYVYNHCDFVRIQKWNPERFAAHSGFSFPPLHDRKYSYRPKPMEFNPIPPEIFKDIFYSCSGSSSLAHRFHLACQPLRHIAQEIMDRLPKRDHPVIMSNDTLKLEELWGLATKERRSALRVLIYLILCTSPTMAFMLAWLYGWAKDGDIQSASMPLTITVAALTLLWTVIYSGTGVD